MPANKKFIKITLGIFFIFFLFFLKAELVEARDFKWCSEGYAYMVRLNCGSYKSCPSGWTQISRHTCFGCAKWDGSCHATVGQVCCFLNQVHVTKCKKFCGTGYWKQPAEYRCSGSNRERLYVEEFCNFNIGDCSINYDWRVVRECGSDELTDEWGCRDSQQVRKIIYRGCDTAVKDCYENIDWLPTQPCGTGEWAVPEEWQCSGTMLQRKYFDRGCDPATGACYSYFIWKDVKDCGGDYWDNKYKCSDDRRYRQQLLWHRGCVGTSCIGPWSSWENIEYCGTSEWGDQYRCSGNKLQRLYIQRECSGNRCYAWSQYKDYQACAPNCCIDDRCRTPVSKTCTPDDAKDSSISELGNSIDDIYCTWNIRHNCQIKSGIVLVAGQLNPDYWEGESCGGGGSSILYGEKKVLVDDISKYLIRARVFIDDNSRVWINEKQVPGLKRGCCGWTSWVDVTSYFNTGWNIVGFEAEDTCSGGRYFNLDWDVSCRPHASTGCFDGDIYWYDSCGNRQEKKQECQTTCFPIELESGCGTVYYTHTCYQGGAGEPSCSQLISCASPDYTEAGTVCECNTERGVVTKVCDGMGNCISDKEKCDIICGSDPACQGLTPGDDYPGEALKRCCKGEEKLPKWKEISP